MADTNCIFCRIAGGDIASSTVYEDEQFRVILDLSPATKGHALILTKQHYANIYEIDDAVLSDLILLAKRVAKAMKATLGCDGVNIVQNNEKASGQTVFHFHLHVIPRYNDDGQQIGWKPGTSEPDEQARLAEMIGSAM